MIILTAIFVRTIILFAETAAFWWVYNHLGLPLPVLSFWQSMGILVLSSILFQGDKVKVKGKI